MVLGGTQYFRRIPAYHSRYEIFRFATGCPFDLRMGMNIPYSHAATMWRIWEQNHKIVQLGVRAQCSEERNSLNKQNLHIMHIS
jgi:hypothetical protein